MDTFKLGEVHPTAVISEHAVLGSNVTVGAFSVIHDGVTVGEGSVIGSHCVLGEPLAEFYATGTAPLPTDVGSNCIIRSHTVVYQGAAIGDGFRSGHRVTIREGTTIGQGVQVGTMSDLQGNLSIGNYARLHSNVFVAQATVIEEFVWLFPRVTITDDPHPPSDTCTRGATIRRFAVVATNSVLMPGITIGAHALVGAMSVVTRDVDPETVVVGAPATLRGSVRDVQCKHGELDAVYPWPLQFRRGYPEGALPDPDTFR